MHHPVRLICKVGCLASVLLLAWAGTAAAVEILSPSEGDTFDIGEVITFSARAICPTTEINWTFGDGETAKGATVTHSYEEAGEHTVTATDSAGSDSVTITVEAANRPPVADDQSVTTDEDTAVAITLTASDPDEDDLTYSIHTGPQHGTLSGDPPSVAYTPDTNYNGADSFKFRANDGEADSEPATVSITVQSVNDAPSADADSEKTSLARGELVQFHSTGSIDVDGTITSYSWEFGDHTASTDANPSHEYATAGDYTVKLTVTDNDGASGSATIDVSVIDRYKFELGDIVWVSPKPSSLRPKDAWILVGESLTFTCEVHVKDKGGQVWPYRERPLTYKWSVDGNVVKEQPRQTARPSYEHTFNKVGVYKVTLDVYYDGQPEPKGPGPATVTVMNFKGVLEPLDNFEGRSMTRYGVAERIKLSAETVPGFTGTLRWYQSPSGGQFKEMDKEGNALFIAPDTAMRKFTLTLKVTTGKYVGKRHENHIEIAAPTKVTLTRTGRKLHEANTCSAGFRAKIFLEPKDVSFGYIFVSERKGTVEKAEGFFDDPASFYYEHPYSGWVTVTAGNSSTGCRVGRYDEVYTKRGPNPVPPHYAHGVFRLRTAWLYSVVEGGGIAFAETVDETVSTPTGKCTISKAGASASAEAAEPTSAAITGRVRRDYDLKGLAGVTVSAGGANAGVTDELGYYAIEGLSYGTYTVTPQPESGYRFDPTSLPDLSVTPTDIVLREQDFVAVGTLSISGKVVTTWGTGLAGVAIGRAVTSGDPAHLGEYKIEGLPPGVPIVLKPQKAGYVFDPSIVEKVLVGDLANLDFEANGEFAVSGRVTEYSTGKGPTPSIPVRIAALVKTASTKPNGRYVIEGVPPGEHVVEPMKGAVGKTFWVKKKPGAPRPPMSTTQLRKHYDEVEGRSVTVIDDHAWEVDFLFKYD